MRTRWGIGAALAAALLAGSAPAANAGTGQPAPTAPVFGPGPDDDHVNLLDLDDLVDDLLYALGLRDHGSNEDSLLDALGLTDDDETPPSSETPPAPAAPAPAPPDVQAIIPQAPPADPGGEAPTGPGALLQVLQPEQPGGEAPGLPAGPPEAPALPADPPAAPGGEAPGVPKVGPDDVVTVPELGGVQILGTPPPSG